MTTETSAFNKTRLVYVDAVRGITRDISQEASDAGCCGHAEGTFCSFCAENGPLPCYYCWDYGDGKDDMGPPIWVFPQEFFEKHVAHDTEASFCKKCGKTIKQLWVPWYPVALGENYHCDCLGYDENGQVKRP